MRTRFTALHGCLLALGCGVSCWALSQEPQQPEYEYVPDTDRWVEMKHGEKYSIGKLDEKGNFLPERKWMNIDIGASRPAEAPSAVLINSPKGQVYEYRSEQLIPGELDDGGNFIPALDRIISFKDYRPGPKAVRIYNLPGQFVKKEQKDGK